MASKFQREPFDYTNLRKLYAVVIEEEDGLVSIPWQELKKETRHGQLCLTVDTRFMPIIRISNISEVKALMGVIKEQRHQILALEQQLKEWKRPPFNFIQALHGEGK